MGPAADAAFVPVLNFVGFGGGGGLVPVDVVATVELGTTEGFRVAFEEVFDVTGLEISMWREGRAVSVAGLERYPDLFRTIMYDSVSVVLGGLP